MQTESARCHAPRANLIWRRLPTTLRFLALGIIVSCGAGLGRRQARTKSSAKAGAKCCANTQTGPGEQCSSGNVAISHFVSSMSTGKLSS